MSIQIARRLARAIGVKSETDIRAINEAILEYVRLTQQSPTTPSPGPSTPGSKALTIETETSTSRTMGVEDVVLCDDDAAAGEMTITLPSAASAEYPRYIKKLGTTANVVIDGAGSETIDDGLTATLTTQFECLMLVPDGSNWHIL